MANVTINNYSLIDTIKSTAPGSKSLLKITDTITLNNECLDDFQWEEGIGLTSHLIGRRKALIVPGMTADNKGFDLGKSEIDNIEEFAAQMGAEIQTDVRTLKRMPNPNGFRAQEDDAAIAAHGEKLVSQVFDGARTTNPLEILGIRNEADWSALAKPNVTGAGGTTGNLYDIFIMQHGVDGFKMWYPRGTQAGLQVEDKGVQRVFDAESKPYYAAVTHFEWHFGKAIYDSRAVQRVTNVKPSDTAQTLEEYLVRAINKLPKRGNMNTTIYVPRPVFDLFDIRAMNKANAAYGVQEIFGRQVVTFRGIPVRMVEALNTPLAAALT